MNKLNSCLALLLIFNLNVHADPVDTVRFAAFGTVTIYKPASAPEAFVLFVSGDGGWNKGVVEMAKNIVDQGALVAGIDIQHYFKAIRLQNVKCHYPAGDFEELSLTLQKKYRLPQYMKPILVGYSSGATLIYGMLAQAPANTFKGAISLGFCPDIETDKTLCNGTGLTSHVLTEGKSYYLEVSEKLSAPFIVLQGMKDQVCGYSETKKYMKGMHFGELISLPKVGHGFSVAGNWLPQFISSYKKILRAPSYMEQKEKENALLQSLHPDPPPVDLPLTLIPANRNDSLPLAFIISGDGGWTSFDQSVSETLAEKGMPVVGLDSQKYFWNAKTPVESAEAIGKAIAHYMKQWNKTSFILAGYSFGGGIAPFIANNFQPGIKESLNSVFCLSPDKTADFEIHIADMLNFNTTEKYDVLEELKKIKTMNPVCIFGEEENIELRNDFSATGTKVITLPGTHHYNNDYNAIAECVLKNLALK